MRLLLSITMLIMSTLACAGAPDLAHIGTPVEDLVYHLRLHASRTSGAVASIYWNYADSANTMRADISLPPRTEDDAILGFDARYAIFRIAGGIDSLLTEGKYSASYTRSAGEISILLSTLGKGRAGLEIGTDRSAAAIEVAFDTDTPASIGYSCSKELKEVRNDIRYTSLQPRRSAPYADVDALMAHIRESEDSGEAVWRFLDRDTDPLYVSSTGSYTLATIARHDRDGYDIVYLSGDTDARWRPLDIKGTMMPTIFSRHYDLTWTDADGHLIAKEASAATDENGSILTLSLPLLKSTVRYAKVHIR